MARASMLRAVGALTLLAGVAQGQCHRGRGSCSAPTNFGEESILLQTQARLETMTASLAAGPVADRVEAAARPASGVAADRDASKQAVPALVARDAPSVTAAAAQAHSDTDRKPSAERDAAEDTFGALFTSMYSALGRNESSLKGHVYNKTTHVSRTRHVWHRDALNPEGDLHNSAWTDGDEGLNFFRSAPISQWAVLVGSCGAFFLLDLFILQSLGNDLGMHVSLIGLWLIFALLFNGWIWSSMGGEAAVEWCSGYFLEWMLSMDNLFVFHLIFKKYKTPSEQMHYAVFIGIAGAVAMRMGFFMVLSTLLHLFTWVRFAFGALLAWSGVQAALGDDDGQDPGDFWVVQSLSQLMGTRLSNRYGLRPSIFQRGADGKWQATLLFVVVFCLEVTDLLFALDSVSAKVAQIPNQYIAFSSSVLAMFGLRAMFFVIDDLVGMFELLPYGLSIILVFIGLQLIFADYVHVPAASVCVLILSVFLVCIMGSYVGVKAKNDGEKGKLENIDADEAVSAS